SPAVGLRTPQRQLNRVVLPAPFGPIKPRISPVSTARSTASSARRPPKWRLRRSASINKRALRECGSGPTKRNRSKETSETEQPAGLDEHDHHEQEPVDEQMRERE